jgi:hypothetical protein
MRGLQRDTNSMEQNLGWFGRAAITETLCDFAAKEKIEMVLTDQHPQVMKVQLRDSGRGMSYKVQIRCRRMGQDNGKDQLVKIANYIEQIRDHIRTTARKPTEEEIQRLMSLLSKRQNNSGVPQNKWVLQS